MPFHIGLFAAIFLRGSSEQVKGFTLQQINQCREREAEARALAASEIVVRTTSP